MMINTKEGNLLNNVLSAQVTRNLHHTSLIEQANKMPFCKRNILLTMITFWDKVFSEVTSDLIQGIRNLDKNWNVNKACLQYLKDNKLANEKFAEFFFNFHEPLTLAFIRKLKRELGNGMPLRKKFQFVADELTELLNIARIELNGMQISCTTFGGEPVCPVMKKCGRRECEDTNDVFFIMMNEEYKIESGLFEKILEVAIHYFEESTGEVIIIVDYKNMEQIDYVFGPRARARYETCLKMAKAVYFYNWKAGLTFSEHFKGLEKFLIPNPKELKHLIRIWKTSKELIEF